MNEPGSLILAVDDNDENLRVVSNFLKGKGYRIALSLNAGEAWEILKTNSVDLILLDVMMPGENGYELCRRIKKDEELKDIPVIFLTARTETDDLVEGFDAGGVDYITKPFRREELLARVNNHMDLALAKKNSIKQAELILQINQTRDRMYSIISHDIKAPFANISMMISMIAENFLDPASEEFKEIIQNLNFSTKETFTLLENLLQWTRTQTGKIECHPEKVLLSELLNNSVSYLANNAELKSIDIRINLPDDVYLNVDPNMINSAFRNLLSNAIKFSHEDGRIDISGRQDNGSVNISFTDYGLGMNEDQLAALFCENIFSSTPGTSNEKGSGLGLHLVKDFTIRNGGEISVKSEPGKGSTFLLKFPSFTAKS